MEDKINCFEIYVQVFSKMDSLYFANKNLYDMGNIGVLLGQMNPFLAGGNISADSAWFEEFSKKMSLEKNVSLKNGFKIIREMLNIYDDKTYRIHDYLIDFDKISATLV